MNCKMCGTLMGDMDLFCKVCGAKNEQTEEPAPQAVSHNILGQASEESCEKGTEKPVSESRDNNEFTWNVYEFPKPRKTEDIDFNWHIDDDRKNEQTVQEDEEPLCWDLDLHRKKQNPPFADQMKPKQREEDTFFESIESEFQTTKKNIIKEYEAVKNRSAASHGAGSKQNSLQEDGQSTSFFDKSSYKQNMTEQNKQEIPKEPNNVIEEFGAGLPEGFFETVVGEEDDLSIQSFDDLPGGYPQRRGRRALDSQAPDTREVTKKADRNAFRHDIDKLQKHKSSHDARDTAMLQEKAAAKEDKQRTGHEETSEPKSLSQKPKQPKEEPATHHRPALMIEEAAAEEFSKNLDGLTAQAPEEDLGEMEKFFTFSKRNEDFQRLLDQEYEKIQKKNAQRPPVSESRISDMMRDTLTPTVNEGETAVHQQEIKRSCAQATEPLENEEEPTAEQKSGELTDASSEVLPQEEDADVSRAFGFIPRKERKKRAVREELAAAEKLAREYENKREPEAASVTAGEEEPPYQTDSLDSVYPNLMKKDNPYVRHLAEMAAARDSFFSEEAESPTQADAKAALTSEGHTASLTEPQETSTEVLVTVAVKSKGAQGTTTKQTISMDPLTSQPVVTTETTIASTDRDTIIVPAVKTAVAEEIKPEEDLSRDTQVYQTRWRQEEAAAQPEDRMVQTESCLEPDTQSAAAEKQHNDSFAALEPGPEEFLPEEQAADFDSGLETEPQEVGCSETIPEDTPQAASEGIDRNNDGLPFDTIPEKKANDFWLNYSYERDPSEQKRFSAGKIALCIIGVLLAAEIAALSVTYLAPDSSAAKMVGKAQVKLVETVKDGMNTVSGWFGSLGGDDQQSNGSQENEKNGTSAENTMGNMTALIQNGLVYNKNIQIIAKGDDLKFHQGKDYGVKDLNDSKPVAEDALMEGNDRETVAQAVVNALIAYDSQWIDYINTGDKAVLQILKPDSLLYKEAQAFDQAGKIYETCTSLSIGDIRQGENGFYVFTKEVVEKNENGTISSLTYDWIYYLEPVDETMLLVNRI